MSAAESNPKQIFPTAIYYELPSDFLFAVEKAITKTDVVLDIGCGIRPINYFKPKLHILVEPCQEYVDILIYRSQGDKSTLIFHQNALQYLRTLADNSVDSIFLIDVIEHIEKNEGLQVVQECERVAREQIIIFTPLGFMPQHVAHGKKDAWGLNGGSFQEHLSGWDPADFSNSWTFHVCKTYHRNNADGQSLEEPFGAFFAIKNCGKKNISVPDKLLDIQIPFHSAFDSEKFHNENISLKAQLENLKIENISLKSQLENLNNEKNITIQNLEQANSAWQETHKAVLNSRSLRVSRFIRKILTKS